MLRQSDDKNEALNIRKKTMRLLINNSETKAAAFREFSDIFSESAKACEKYFQISMTDFQTAFRYSDSYSYFCFY